MERYALFTVLFLIVVGLVLFVNKDFAPQMENVAIKDIDGNVHQLLDAKPVLVNIWASDCNTCFEELPKLNALYNTYSDQGFRVIAIALDYDNLPAIRATVNKLSLNFIVAHDQSNQLVPLWGKLTAIPTNFLLDSAGRVVNKTIGEPNWEQWEQKIQQLL